MIEKDSNPLMLYVILSAITVSIGTAIVMIFWAPYPSTFQYRIVIALICFALSSIAGVLFFGSAKVDINAKIGPLTLTVGGAAVLWLASLIIFDFIFPEEKGTTIYQLRLNLLFPHNEAANPFEAKVTGFVQRHGEMSPAIYNSLRLDRGVGGLVVNFDELQEGDKLYVITEDDGKQWRSDDMVMPTAHLKMNPSKDMQP